MLKPVVAYLHTKGIRNSVFIDDGRILAKTEKDPEDFRKLTYKVLGKAGWTLEDKKSDKEGQASQIKEYLGFVNNYITMTIQLKDDRKEAIKKDVQKTLKHKSRPIHVKDLAKTLGKKVATEPALGSMPLMASRAAYIQLDEAKGKQGWNCNLTMNNETIASLGFFRKHGRVP
jgi:hypothetical protein